MRRGIVDPRHYGRTLAPKLIGFAVSRLVCREGVYHALARNHVAAATPPH
jgi:hypothetical protein